MLFRLRIACANVMSATIAGVPALGGGGWAATADATRRLRRGPRWRRRARLLAATSVAALALGAVQAASSSAYVYWTNGYLLQRSELDGSDASTDGYSGTGNGQSTGIFGVAVDGAHLYWSNYQANTIGRSSLNGYQPDQHFLPAHYPTGVAVDGAHVYWTNLNKGTIGRSNLNGTGVNQSFITGAYAYAVAVDGAHLYWTNLNAIGRSNLDGTDTNQNFIAGLSYPPAGVAVDGAHIYWTNPHTAKMGRSKLDGTGVNQSFMSIGEGTVDAVAVDGAHIYWTNKRGIGRSNLDGSGANQRFISAYAPTGLAVDGLSTPVFVLRVTPRKVSVGKKVLLRFRVTTSRRQALPGVKVTVHGAHALTGPDGKAKLKVRFKHTGHPAVTATLAGYRKAVVHLTVKNGPR
jgi:virginiamycin B lyase